MLKSILMISTITGLSVSSVTPMVNQLNSYIDFKDSFINFLQTDIEENKVYLGTQTYSKYNDELFTSDNAMNEYILSNSLVQSEFTSSNPYKIIKDYSNMILDENKIYDLDMNKFVPVYRDAFGNIAKTSKDALNTYTNSGLVRQKYSYDEQDWFDSPEEAKLYQQDSNNINKSLYYIHNNKYYNAFNQKDIDSLLSTFEEGYFVNRENRLNGNPLPQSIIEYGNKEEIRKKLKSSLEDDFKNYYYGNNITNVTTDNYLQFGIKNNSFIDIQYYGKSIQAYSNGSNPTLHFVDKFNSKEEMLNDFKNHSKWREGKDNRRYYWRRTFNVYDGNTKTIAEVTLWPKKINSGTITASFDDYTYNDVSKNILTTYYDESKTKVVYNYEDAPTPIYTSSEVTTETKNKIYNSWFNVFIDSNVTNFGINTNKYATYENIKNENFIKNIDGTVYKDLMYDVNNNQGYSYSLIQSYYEWLLIKGDLLNNPTMIDGQKMYQLRPDFFATEEQLDNFLQLQGKFSAVLKYSSGSIADLSSTDGKLLSDTYLEAKEKQLLNKSQTLKKKYIAYDVFGNAIESGNSEEEAIRLLQNNIALESKMTHRQEYDSWNWNVKKSYDSIISDGRYLVYKVKDELTNNYLYYPTQEIAMNAVLANAKNNGSSSKIVMDKYMYTYYDQENNKEHSVIFYDNNIHSAIDQILTKIKY